MPGATHAPQAGAAFSSVDEFVTVVERLLALMRDDPDVGPGLRAADVPQCLRFPDLGQAVTIRAGRAGEPNLVWRWGEDPGWSPRVTMAMDSAIANRYFQGRENVAVAVARRRIRASGDTAAAVSILPLLRPVFARYRELIAAEYPHLEA